MQVLDGYKKIIAVALLVIIRIFGETFGLDQQSIADIQQGLMVYIGAQGFADLGKYISLPKSKPEPPKTEML